MSMRDGEPPTATDPVVESEPTAGGSDFKDRRVGLRLFGCLQIAIASICALLLLVSIVGLAASPPGDDPESSWMARIQIPGLVLYALLSVLFVVLGIGSILLRRWARALSLVVSWLWLAFGVIGLVFLAMMTPGILDRVAVEGEVQGGVAIFAMAFLASAVAFFYVVLPGGLVAFYGSQNVRATCVLRDPQPRWTDGVPIPILILCTVHASWAFSMLWWPFCGFPMVLFGVWIDGLLAVLVAVGLTAIGLYLAWSTYRLKMAAWWGALAIGILWGVSTMISMSGDRVWELYRRIGMPEEQLQALRHMDLTQIVGVSIWAYWVASTAFVLYTRRYFIRAAAASNEE